MCCTTQSVSRPTYELTWNALEKCLKLGDSSRTAPRVDAQRRVVSSTKSTYLSLIQLQVMSNGGKVFQREDSSLEEHVRKRSRVCNRILREPWLRVWQSFVSCIQVDW